MGYPEGVQLSSGLGGRLPSDSVAAWHRIGWQESPEYACKRLPTLELSQDERECRSPGLWRNGLKACPHPRVPGRPFHTLDGLHLAFGPLFVKGEQGGGFEGQPGKCRQPRLV
jgi:hypothetical protein